MQSQSICFRLVYTVHPYIIANVIWKVLNIEALNIVSLENKVSIIRSLLRFYNL